MDQELDLRVYVHLVLGLGDVSLNSELHFWIDGALDIESFHLGLDALRFCISHTACGIGLHLTDFSLLSGPVDFALCLCLFAISLLLDSFEHFPFVGDATILNEDTVWNGDSR